MEATMTDQNKTLQKQSDEPSGCLPALARLYWIAAGNVVVFFCALYIVLRKATFAVYLIYILATICLIGVRFIDIKYFMGEKLNGKRASLRHWLRYTLGLLIFVGLLFVAARILAKWNLFGE
jgi:hypothetical protein